MEDAWQRPIVARRFILHRLHTENNRTLPRIGAATVKNKSEASFNLAIAIAARESSLNFMLLKASFVA